MIKWPITYTDYNDETHTEDFYFNLSKAELMEMDLEANGAFSSYLKRIVEEKDGKQMAKVFKDIIYKAYGRRSDDGRRFVKSDEYVADFVSCGAYSELFMQLVSDSEACDRFVTGIMPKFDNGKVEISDGMKVV